MNITDNAIKQIKSLLSEQSEERHLRVQVVGGGCSGLSYKLSFEATPKEKDITYSKDNVTVIVDQKSNLFLLGTTLDYDGGLNGKGFTFDNPSAKKSCGCGNSFNV